MHSPVGFPPPAFALSPRIAICAGLFLMAATALVSLAWLHRTAVTTGPESPNDRTHIQRVLDLEAQHRQILWSQSRGGIPSLSHQDLTDLIDACRDYEHELAQLDLTGCPPTFRTAFAKHRETWKSVRLALSDLAGLTDLPPADYPKAIHQVTAPLTASWATVKDAAERHGVLVGSSSGSRD